MYKVVCAWCGRILKDGMSPATHGICLSCMAQELLNDLEAERRELECKQTSSPVVSVRDVSRSA